VDDLRKKHDIAVILVTHDLAGISSYADRLILLNRSVIAEGEPGKVLSNEKLIEVFGPSLWNISCLSNLTHSVVSGQDSQELRRSDRHKFSKDGGNGGH